MIIRQSNFGSERGTMSKEETTDELGRFDMGIIRLKVSQLVGRHGFRLQDREQLVQELAARLWQSLQSYDPNQSHRNSFVTTVVERSVASIIRDQYAEKRDDRRVLSLNQNVKQRDGSHGELAQLVSASDGRSRRGVEPKSEQELTELKSDVEQCLNELPVELRELAEELKYKSVVQIARDRGVSRGKVRSLVNELRKRLKDSGLRFYQ
ncbi:MAG: sigma-70 family RNA polymerase sigma factor [Pirellulaceae bacterium]